MSVIRRKMEREQIPLNYKCQIFLWDFLWDSGAKTCSNIHDFITFESNSIDP